MNKLLRNKFFIILLCGGVLMFFNIAIKRIPLNNRGIIMGLGIDKAESGEGYKITAQTILSTEGGGTTKSEMATNFYILESEGKSIIDAVQKISNQSAITPAFKDCILVIFGKDLVKKDIDYLTEYLFNDNIISDHSMLVRSEEKAGDSLKKKIPNTTVLTFHLSRLFNPKYAQMGINAVTLRNYSVTKHTETINYLPLFKPIEAETSQGSGSGEEPEKEYYFDVFTTSVVADSGVIDLSEEESFGLSIILGRVREGSLDVSHEDRRISFNITSINSKLSFSPDDFSITAKITAIVKLNEIVEPDNVSSLIVDLTEDDTLALQKTLDKYVSELLAFSKRENLDILGFYEGYYAKGGNRWANSAPDNYIEKTTLKTNYDVHVT